MAAVSLLQEHPTPPRPRSGRGSRATSVGAPATTTSSRPCWPRRAPPRPRRERNEPRDGERLLRREDPALLTGEAKYVGDLAVPGALHVALVRSPFAHARIRSVDTAAAAALPGVVAVFTGADLQDEWANPMPCAWPVTDDMKSPAHLPVAVDKACYAGDAVAVIVAESSYQAEDAAAAVVVDYDPLPAVVDLETRCPTGWSSTTPAARTGPTRGS